MVLDHWNKGAEVPSFWDIAILEGQLGYYLHSIIDLFRNTMIFIA